MIAIRIAKHKAGEVTLASLNLLHNATADNHASDEVVAEAEEVSEEVAGAAGAAAAVASRDDGGDGGR